MFEIFPFLGDCERRPRPIPLRGDPGSLYAKQDHVRSPTEKQTPAGTADRGKHVDEERRAVLRPVVLQGPCLLIEADGTKTLKTI